MPPLSSVPTRELSELTLALVACPSPNPPGDERQAVAALQRFISSVSGVRSRVFEPVAGRPTLVCSVGTGSPCLAFAAHMDTHPTADGWTQNPLGALAAGRVYGRGTTDDKGAVAAMALAFRRLAGSFDNRPGRLVLIANADEEMGGAAGIAHLMTAWDERPDAVVVAEASGVDAPWECLWTAARGTSRFIVTARGTKTHSSLAGREGISSAVEVLMPVIAEIGDKLHLLHESHPVFGRGNRMTVVRIEGGDGWGTVPGVAKALCELRLLPHADQKRIEEQVTQAFQIVLRNLGAEADLEFAPGGLRWMSSSETIDATPIVQLCDQAWATVMGSHPTHSCFPGATDARLFEAAGIPSVIIGPGALVRAHHADEFVTADELDTAYSLYVEIASRFFGREPGVNDV